MTERPNRPAHEIEPGMQVEASDADFGETDVSRPRIKHVRRGPEGHVESLVVEKGALFKKEIEVLAERIEHVERAGESGSGPGKVRVSAAEHEVAAMTNTGADTLPARADGAPGAGPREELDEEHGGLLQTLGPGLLNGMAGNDSSAVTTYAVDGAQAGYGHLWLLLVTVPLLQAAQYACAKIGRLTGKGLVDVLKEHYSGRAAGGIAALLVVGNLALIAADLVAIGSGLELITGLGWLWFILPAGAVLWYVTVYQDYNKIKTIFLALSLVFVTYLVTAVLAKPDWGQVLSNSFIPHVDLGMASISAAVALLGATISPYQLVWQVHAETEEQRPGDQQRQLRLAAVDVASGVLSNIVVSYAIIVATAATLFTQHKPIASAVDAARALEPLVGPFAKYLFAVGLIGSGMIAIPVLLASTSYAVAGSFGWPASLAKKPWQNEGFYVILTAALLASLGLAALGFNPIQLIFWANIVQGVLAPVLVVTVLLVGNNRKIMRDNRLGLLTNLGLGITALLLTAALVLFVYGLVTGQGS